jgi:ABC-type antimicrobial peptide transport system permease subunit
LGRSNLFLTTTAGSALLLAALGIYSVLSYFVVSRRKEIGVRMAVGASRFQIYRLAAGSAGKPIVIGIALGLSSAIAGSRLIEKLLYGVRALDTWVIASTVGILILVSALSAFFPAHRAASVNPIKVLRVD